MINLKILVPEATTNYIKNPSFEKGTAGWTIKEESYDSDNYHLYDKFTTDLAAGAINGSSAEPVGGVRTVTDTNSKISITGGVLSFATGAATANGIWYASLARLLGRTAISSVNITSDILYFGWDANTSGAISDSILFNTSSVLQINSNGTPFSVGAWSAGIYELAVVMRSAGMFYFIRGGAFTNYTMIHSSLTGSGALRPSSVCGDTTTIYTIDNIRVPKLIYIPVPLQSDGFSSTTTDGLGNPENNGPVGNAYDGVGTPQVSAGVRSFSALSGGGLGVSVLACSTADVNIEVNVTRTAGSAGIIARRTDGNNYIQCLHTGVNVVVSQVVAGVTTALSTTAVAYSAGATMKLYLSGTTYVAFYNNTAAGSGVVPASTNGSHGIITNDLSGSFDNLVIWARGGEGHYDEIDALDPTPDAEARSLDRARFGIASGKIVTDGSMINEGTYYRVNWLQGISDVLTASIYARGGGKVRLRLTDGGSNSGISKAVNLTDNRWTRLEVTGRCSGSDDIRLYVETADSLPRAVTFYVDGAQLERNSEATSYCDGDQEGCRWNNVRNSTLSTRDANSRAGGRWVPLAGPCRPNNDLYVTVLGGFGMPPVTNNIQSWANAPGAFFQNEKIQNRVVTLSFHVKNANFRTGGSAPSISALNELRQQLIDLIKSDLTLNSEAFLFEYSDSDTGKSLYMRMRYEAGLEGEWDIRNRWTNSFPVRLIAVDPFWSEDTQDVLQLGIKETSTAASAWVRTDGVWSSIKNSAGSPILDVVQCFAEAPDGTIYIGGSFVTPTGITRVCKWDGTELTNLGNGGADDYVSGLAVGPDGMVYAVGEFTTIGGVAASGVAKYNPTTNTWAAMGSGFTHSAIPLGTAPCVCVAPNGQVYVGGNFTTVGGVTCYRIARWDGQWRTVGQFSGLSSPVTSIVNAGDGNTLYVGGYFAREQGGTGLTLNGVASLDITTNLFTQLGYGVGPAASADIQNGVRALAVGLDGTLYAGGVFTQSGAPDASPLLAIAKWSGGQIWEPMGDGFYNSFGGGTSATVYGLDVGVHGEVYAVGFFDLTGERQLSAFAKWFGNSWNPVGFPSLYQGVTNSDYLIAVLETKEGNLLVGGSLVSKVSYPYINTVTNNGTTSCWPLMYIKGQGTVRYIANNKTGQEIFLDLVVFENEEVTIDFARGKITSSVRGDLSYSILPGSEVRAIYLLPGDNEVSILVTNDVAAIMQLRWELLDWSADAVVEPESL